MRRPAATTRWLALTGLCLATVSVFTSSAVPIYDGLGNPDEPYRYVVPPPGYRDTPPPTSASMRVEVATGRSAATRMKTAESGPQLSLVVADGALARSGSATGIVVTAAPVAPDDPLPSDGSVVGNVYRITARVPGGVVDVVGAGDQVPELDMRAPTGRQPGPVFEHLVEGEWVRSRTLRVGYDIYETSMSAFGDWALVQLDRPSGDESGDGVATALLLAGAGVAGVGLVVLAVRRRRPGSPPGEVSR